MPFVTNLFPVMGVQNLSTSVKICQSYWQKFAATFFMPEGISHRWTAGKFGGTSSSNRRRWKTPLANGIPLDLPLLPEAFCNVAIGRELLGVLYWKINKNAKIGELWCPIAPKPYVLQKGWPKYLRTSLTPRLQRGVNRISVQCVPCAVGWSE